MRDLKLSRKLQALPEQFFSKLVANVNRKIEAGNDVINLGQGNPDRPTPNHIVEALKVAVDNPLNHKYSPFDGKLELKQAVVEFYQREYQVTLDPQTEVAILFGSKTGLVELPMCVMDEGDWMLLPDPGYPDYLSGVALGGVHYETMPLRAENHYLPDYTKISAETLKKAEMMYLNYPNNPTGAVATPAFFEETVKLANENAITIVHDFAYASIGFDGEKPISFLQTEGAKDVGIELYTLSKTYNMAGWRVAFAVGNKEIVRAINLIQDHLYVSLFPAIQDAAIVALTSDQSEVEKMRQTYESRRDHFIAACKNIGWQVEAPAGSFFAWLKVPAGFTSTSFSDFLLEEVNVAVAPGNGFGEEGEGYVRVGLLMDEERLEEAARRIGESAVFQKSVR